jgi:hypothetical protein
MALTDAVIVGGGAVGRGVGVGVRRIVAAVVGRAVGAGVVATGVFARVAAAEGVGVEPAVALVTPDGEDDTECCALG